MARVSLLFFYLRLRSFRHPKISRFHDVTMWKICQRNWTWLQIWRAPWIKGKILIYTIYICIYTYICIYIYTYTYIYMILPLQPEFTGEFPASHIWWSEVHHAGYISHLWTIFSSFLLGIGYCQKTPPLHEITNWVMGKTPIFDAKYSCVIVTWNLIFDA